MIMNIKEMPVIAGIYKINYPNGKIYIGQSQNIQKRIKEHNQRAKCTTSSKKLLLCDQALRKYNLSIEEIEILEIITDINILDERETYWINYYDSTNRDKGYNIVNIGNVSSKRGVNHVNAAFTEKTLLEVIDLLINHPELSFIDIAKKYGVEQNTIYRISAGKTYYNPELTYPLRNNNHESQKKDIENYFNDEKKLLNLKEDLYYRWDLKIESDLIDKYQIPLRILRDINNGRKFENIGDFNYPIRKKNIRNNKNFTQQDIVNILKELRTTTNSQTDIGLKYGINRSTVSAINLGTAYPIKDYDYPARKN